MSGLIIATLNFHALIMSQTLVSLGTGEINGQFVKKI